MSALALIIAAITIVLLFAAWQLYYATTAPAPAVHVYAPSAPAAPPNRPTASATRPHSRPHGQFTPAPRPVISLRRAPAGESSRRTVVGRTGATTEGFGCGYDGCRKRGTATCAVYGARRYAAGRRYTSGSA